MYRQKIRKLEQERKQCVRCVHYAHVCVCDFVGLYSFITLLKHECDVIVCFQEGSKKEGKIERHPQVCVCV